MCQRILPKAWRLLSAALTGFLIIWYMRHSNKDEQRLEDAGTIIYLPNNVDICYRAIDVTVDFSEHLASS